MKSTPSRFFPKVLRICFSSVIVRFLRDILKCTSEFKLPRIEFFVIFISNRRFEISESGYSFNKNRFNGIL
ncbi:hypothetical protein BES34_008285 [Leptospira inadai serovar Lyme]|uniref:Lipoprotein n=1 Tax=Leptospira inadai serovar Lyme TaxID=293084 RepID=A0ABX4YK03_9LEPT|nr:hypothetical protein BES34_008285 [Leptospira inadai serovar Lyme]